MARSTGNRLAAVSKEMSKVLRHQPPEGAMDASGWMEVSVLVQHLKSQPTLEEVREVVRTSEKSRFALDEGAAGVLRIRATQGHSVHLKAPVLEAVTHPEQVELAVHVTSAESWRCIQETGELRRMRRMHIHLATLPSHVRSNAWATVWLVLDLSAAMEAGHPFFLSTNSVLLCEGPLPARFLRQVQVADLPEAWRDAAASHRRAQHHGMQAGDSEHPASPRGPTQLGSSPPGPSAHSRAGKVKGGHGKVAAQLEQHGSALTGDKVSSPLVGGQEVQVQAQAGALAGALAEAHAHVLAQ